uniref:BTB domain-containing protein n=1 Tax=Caenorhabditis tropicalis TaxID=1561998 RepID=A0A1I7TAG5_9PELO
MPKKEFTYTNDLPMTCDRPLIFSRWGVDTQTSYANGVRCHWISAVPNTYVMRDLRIFFEWDFDVSKIKRKKNQKWQGHIILTSPNGFEQKFVFESTKNYFSVCKSFEFELSEPVSFDYEYRLVLCKSVVKKEEVDMTMFLPSNKTDAVLLVEKKKIHVNKGFLSYHSEFFRVLFSSSFTEAKMAEIPIKDVKYKDFLLLLATIYPNAVRPTDSNVWKILELAQRFLMGAPIRVIEEHLKNTSNFSRVEIYMMKEMCSVPGFMEEKGEDSSSDSSDDEDEGDCFEDLFLASDVTDAVLLVKDGQLHVNKGFLSFHSDYFADLFSSDQSQEYEIKDVSYNDLASLLGTIHPNPVYPTYKNDEQLLKLAQQFLMPGALSRIENYLILL